MEFNSYKSLISTLSDEITELYKSSNFLAKENLKKKKLKILNLKFENIFNFISETKKNLKLKKDKLKILIKKQKIMNKKNNTINTNRRILYKDLKKNQIDVNSIFFSNKFKFLNIKYFSLKNEKIHTELFKRKKNIKEFIQELLKFIKHELQINIGLKNQRSNLNKEIVN